MRVLAWVVVALGLAVAAGPAVAGWQPTRRVAGDAAARSATVSVRTVGHGRLIVVERLGGRSVRRLRVPGSAHAGSPVLARGPRGEVALAWNAAQSVATRSGGVESREALRLVRFRTGTSIGRAVRRFAPAGISVDAPQLAVGARGVVAAWSLVQADGSSSDPAGTAIIAGGSGGALRLSHRGGADAAVESVAVVRGRPQVAWLVHPFATSGTSVLRRASVGRGGLGPVQTEARIDRDPCTTRATSRPPTERGFSAGSAAEGAGVLVRSAAPGRRLRPVQRLGRTTNWEPTIAPDGRIAIAYGHGDDDGHGGYSDGSLRVIRGRAGTPLRDPERIEPGTSRDGFDVAVTLDRHGRSYLVWSDPLGRSRLARVVGTSAAWERPFAPAVRLSLRAARPFCVGPTVIATATGALAQWNCGAYGESHQQARFTP